MIIIKLINKNKQNTFHNLSILMILWFLLKDHHTSGAFSTNGHGSNSSSRADGPAWGNPGTPKSMGFNGKSIGKCYENGWFKGGFPHDLGNHQKVQTHQTVLHIFWCSNDVPMVFPLIFPAFKRPSRLEFLPFLFSLTLGLRQQELVKRPESCWQITIWRFLEIGGAPKPSIFDSDFPLWTLNHPFGGTPIYGNPIWQCCWRTLTSTYICS